MKIGILGSGNIGSTLAALFSTAGHEVALSNSGDPQALAAKARELGAHVTATAATDAVAFGDVVILAVPWTKRHTIPAAPLFAGKIVVDAMNPYTSGGVQDLSPSTSSEEVAKQLPGARLVKAFNTMWSEHLRKEGKPGSPHDKRITMFIAGDDAAAKQIVSDLIAEIGFAPFDTGSLHEGGRKQEPGSPIYNNPMPLTEAKIKFGELQ